ncbi:MAG: hypothetical protein V4795_23945 [Pseudomonadota bacterium]
MAIRRQADRATPPPGDARVVLAAAPPGNTRLIGKLELDMQGTAKAGATALPRHGCGRGRAPAQSHAHAHTDDPRADPDRGCNKPATTTGCRAWWARTRAAAWVVSRAAHDQSAR